jgi:hypothetical protein
MYSTPCPHGNHHGTTAPHDELRHICAVCGGPRVPSTVATSGAEIPALRAAKDAYTRRTSWRFGSGCSALVAAFGGVLGLALLRLDSSLATTVGVAFLVTALPFAIVFATGLAKAARYSRELTRQVAEAWQRALRDVVVSAPGPLHSAGLAQLLGVREEEADRWLAELSAEGVLRSEITEEGQVVYRPTSGARIEVGSAVAQGGVRIDAQGIGVAPTELEGSEHLDDRVLEARFAELARREANKPR